MLEVFLEGIKEKRLVEIEFIAKSDGKIRKRKCIPFDYGASSKSKDKGDKYHFYDLDSPSGRHNLSIEPAQLKSIELTKDLFDPADYITWEPSWIISRDWGEYS